MLDETQKAKVQRFLDDKIMSDTIYDILLEDFLKCRKTGEYNVDVQYLAASRLAIDLLQDAWLTLEKYKKEREVENNNQTNVGL